MTSARGRALYLPLAVPTDQKDLELWILLTAIANFYIFEFWGKFISWRERDSGWNFLMEVLMGEIGQVQGPLLFQILKPADSSCFHLLFIYPFIFSSSESLSPSLPLPFPTLPSFRQLKSSCSYSLSKLGSHKG